MYLFFDTETTGFYDFKLPPDHPSQPYIVQLAALLCAEDSSVLMAMSTIVFNPGIAIPDKAAAVHGISTEMAHAYGVTIETALDWFLKLWANATLLVAHNMAFDKAVLETAIARRYGRHQPIRLPVACTMEMATPVLKIAATPAMQAAGFGDKFKAPKLSETIMYLFNEEHTGAHDALADVQACARAFFHLKKMEPTVT